MNIEELKEEIKNIQEPRRTRYGNIRHKLEDIIIIGLCTIICGGEDFADREYQLLTNLSWLEQKDEWNGLNALGCAKSTIAENREIREFTRYFITSLTVLETFADSVVYDYAASQLRALLLIFSYHSISLFTLLATSIEYLQNLCTCSGEGS